MCALPIWSASLVDGHRSLTLSRAEEEKRACRPSDALESALTCARFAQVGDEEPGAGRHARIGARRRSCLRGGYTWGRAVHVCAAPAARDKSHAEGTSCVRVVGGAAGRMMNEQSNT